MMLPGDAPRRVLIVDDEPDVRESLARLLDLEIQGLEVHMAAGPEEALEFLEENHVEVLVVDYRMPKMNGLELLAKVRPKHPDTIPILITAYPSLDLALQAVNEQHIRFFVTKPFQEADMVSTVTEALDEYAAAVA